MDDPTADYACLPTYKLAEAAKGTLTVVLTGEGGDELFGGYGRYRRALRPTAAGRPAAEPQADAPMLPDGGAGRARGLARAAKAAGRIQPAAAQYADIATWLPNDLLLKLDRCLMAHGAGGRTPFLDREVAAFASALPDRLKVQGRYGKCPPAPLAGDSTRPASEPWARKQGFTVPVAAWIAPRARDLAPQDRLGAGRARRLRPAAGRGGLRRPRPVQPLVAARCSSPCGAPSSLDGATAKEGGLPFFLRLRKRGAVPSQEAS